MWWPVILKFWFLLDCYRWAWILFNVTWLNQENLKRDDTFVFPSDKRYLFFSHIHGVWINLWMRWTFLDGLPEGVDLAWLKCRKDLLGFRSSRSRSQRPVHLRKKKALLGHRIKVVSTWRCSLSSWPTFPVNFCFKVKMTRRKTT